MTRYDATWRPVTTDASFMVDAACRNYVWLFDYTHDHFERSGRKNAKLRAAIAVCRSCPVQQLCLEWAITNDMHTGVWGGYTARERRRLRRQRRRGAA